MCQNQYLDQALDIPALQGFSAPPGSRITSETSQKVYETERSERHHQVFDFAGQSEPTQGQEGFVFARESPQQPAPARPQTQEEEQFEDVIDHPHMRSSFDSEQGVPFISELNSPLQTQTGSTLILPECICQFGRVLAYLFHKSISCIAKRLQDCASNVLEPLQCSCPIADLWLNLPRIFCTWWYKSCPSSSSM